MRIEKKIKASALHFAILVSVIVAVLLGSFLTLTHTQRFFKIQSKFFTQVIQAANEGVNYTLDPKNTFIDSIKLDIQNGSTLVKKGFWGGFITVESTSKIKTKTFVKKAFIGAKPTNPRTSIYLGDTQLPLVLVGNTHIEGTAYISKKGIKSGVISGHYYNGKPITDSDIKLSSGILPKLDKVWFENSKRILEYVPSSDDNMIPIEIENKNSFFERTEFIYDADGLVLTQEYIGNIIIKSETEIVISKSARLVNVFIIAPKIIVESGFNGNAHLLAQESIKIEEDVRLSYPSSITLLDDNVDFKKPIVKGEEPIFIDKGSTIEGNVIYLAKENIENRSNTSISISDLATIKGSIYCNGNTELMGVVEGSIYTNRFVTNEFGSKYLNHIYNGKILGNDINPQFSGLPLEEMDKSIAKWLY